MAGELPGAFSQGAPYGMPKRIKKQLGSPPTSTVGTSTNTVSSLKPKGMGMMKSQLGGASSKMAGLGSMPGIKATKNLFGGGKMVGPHMKTTVKPTKAMSIRYASAYPTADEALDAISDPDLGAHLLTKEGQEDRVMRTFEAYGELTTATDPQEKLAALLELAALRRESEMGVLARSRA